MCYRSKIPSKSLLVLSEEMRLIITLLFLAHKRRSILAYLLCGAWESRAGVIAYWPLQCPSHALCIPRAPGGTGQLQGHIPLQDPFSGEGAPWSDATGKCFCCVRE